MTVLSGDTAVQAQTMTDKEVVDSCMNTLRKLFPYEVRHSRSCKTFLAVCDKRLCSQCLVPVETLKSKLIFDNYMYTCVTAGNIL